MLYDCTINGCDNVTSSATQICEQCKALMDEIKEEECAPQTTEE